MVEPVRGLAEKPAAMNAAADTLSNERLVAAAVPDSSVEALESLIGDEAARNLLADILADRQPPRAAWNWEVNKDHWTLRAWVFYLLHRKGTPQDHTLPSLGSIACMILGQPKEQRQDFVEALRNLELIQPVEGAEQEDSKFRISGSSPRLEALLQKLASPQGATETVPDIMQLPRAERARRIYPFLLQYTTGEVVAEMLGEEGPWLRLNTKAMSSLLDEITGHQLTTVQLNKLNGQLRDEDLRISEGDDHYVRQPPAEESDTQTGEAAQEEPPEADDQEEMSHPELLEHLRRIAREKRDLEERVAELEAELQEARKGSLPIDVSREVRQILGK